MLKKFINAVTGAIKSTPFTRNLHSHTSGSWDLMLYVTKFGSIYLQILNDPYRVDPAHMAHIVGHGLDKGVVGHKVHFTTDHAKAAHPSYRVILAFNPPKDFDFKRLAHGETPPVVDHGEKHTVLAAFCNNDQALVAAAGSLSKEMGVDSEAFHTWMVSLSTHLFVKGRHAN